MRRRNIKQICLLFVCVFAAIPCAAETIIVDANGTGDYPTIQAAIDDANDGDIIELQPGVYTGDGNRDIDYKGKAITIRSTDPNDSNVVAATIIECNGTEADPHRGFYFHSGEGVNSVLEGITITNGYGHGEATPRGLVSLGGAFYFINVNPAISKCTISNNWAWYGGGMYNDANSSPTITNCTITENMSSREGGGIYCNNSSPTITNCAIRNNNTGRSGGGIRSSYSNLTINDCTFIGNQAERYGGGISSRDLNLTLTNCTFIANSGGISGGGVCLSGSNAIISDCTFSGNVVGNEGGGICLWGSNPIIVGCTIKGNAAYASYGDGGGIKCWGSSPRIMNCLIANNDAKNGGAISSGYNGEPEIIQCTITRSHPKTLRRRITIQPS